MVRRHVFERTGGVSANYVSVDGDLIYRLFECRCHIRYLDLDLYKWYIHPHSGFNKSREMQRDYLLIAIRLGRWDRLFSYDPEQLADIIDYRERQEGMSQLYGIRAVSVLARTPLPPLLLGLELMFRVVRSLVRTVRPRLRILTAVSSSSTATTPIKERQWTGRLR